MFGYHFPPNFGPQLLIWARLGPSWPTPFLPNLVTIHQNPPPTTKLSASRSSLNQCSCSKEREDLGWRRRHPFSFIYLYYNTCHFLWNPRILIECTNGKEIIKGIMECRLLHCNFFLPVTFNYLIILYLKNKWIKPNLFVINLIFSLSYQTSY